MNNPLEEISGDKYLAKIKYVVADAHKHSINSLTYFPEPYFRVVSTCDDYNIGIFCAKTGKLIKILLDGHTNAVNHCIKIKPEIFITGSTDETALAFSIKTLEKLKTFAPASSTVARLLKLNDENDDLFLTLHYDNTVCIVSYSENTVIRKLNKQKGGYRVELSLSLVFKNCIYFNTFGDEEEDSIRLINFYSFISREEKMEFVTKDYKTISHYTNFLNSKNEELLAMSYDDENEDEETGLIIYKIGKTLPVNGNFIKRIPTKGHPRCVRNFHNKYLLCSTEDGYLQISNLQTIENEQQIEIEDSLRLYNNDLSTAKYNREGKIVDIVEVDNSFWGEDFGKSVSFAITSSSHDIKFLSIIGMDFNESSFARQDLKERVEFLFSEIECFVFETEKEKIIRLETKNLEIKNIFKSFFYL